MIFSTKEDAIVEEVSSQFENMIVFHRVTEGLYFNDQGTEYRGNHTSGKRLCCSIDKAYEKEKGTTMVCRDWTCSGTIT